MYALVILNNKNANNVRVILNLHTKGLRNKVSSLMEEKRRKDAFDLVVSKARFETYLPPGQKTTIKPELIFVEDML